MTIQFHKLKDFPNFVKNSYRYNYQLLWEQQNQDAYINFFQVLTEVELLLFKIS